MSQQEATYSIAQCRIISRNGDLSAHWLNDRGVPLSPEFWQVQMQRCKAKGKLNHAPTAATFNSPNLRIVST